MGTEDFSLAQVEFESSYTRLLPADPNTKLQSRQVHKSCFSRVLPKQCSQPSLIAFSPETIQLLNLPSPALGDQEFAEVFSGNRLLDGMDAYASCYGGHQFGTWAGQLGDGRAIHIGERIGQGGKRWYLQLKGAGPTPYSRGADGFAVLRSSLREFLCSEAMAHLGIPTTRALSLTLTGDDVVRDMFYNGNPQAEPGAIVCRVSQSFTRFGNFEIFASRADLENMEKLLQFVLAQNFPQLGPPTKESYIAFFNEVCQSTCRLMVEWMRVGFVHGVMNTDNMSILGETIDYGPYGWLENYDPMWTPNTTDAGTLRYAFGQQAKIAMWNLCQLGNALHPLIENVDALNSCLDQAWDQYEADYRDMMLNKIGLAEFDPAIDLELIEDLTTMLEACQADMTVFFRQLASFNALDFRSEANPKLEKIDALKGAFYDEDKMPQEAHAKLMLWLDAYARRLDSNKYTDKERIEKMNSCNPKYVLRNYLAHQAIEKAEAGDYSMIEELLSTLKKPYTEQADKESFAAKRPDWAKNKAGCSTLSCSS